MRRMLLVFVLGLAAATGCAPPKMLDSWKSPELQKGSLRRMLIIGVFPTPGGRETVEGQFVDQLRQDGMEPMASHSYVRADEMNAAAITEKLGFEAIVLARLLDRPTYEQLYPPKRAETDMPVGYSDAWYPEYVRSKDTIANTDSSLAAARVETRVFDARAQKLVWSGVSKNELDGRDPAQIHDAVAVILKSMREEGLY